MPENVGAASSQSTPVVYRAPWILPIAQPPIREGWVAVQDGLIVNVGGRGQPLPSSAEIIDVDGAIMPGLVNAHTHLELSWMRGQVPPAPSMPQWVERLMALRRTVGHEPSEPIVDAILEARAAGTTLVGDVTNTLAAYQPLVDSGLSAAVFRELLGFNVQNAAGFIKSAREQIAELTLNDRLRPSIVPHAPYSVTQALLRAIADGPPNARISMHLGESAEEIEFLRAGQGAWRDLLDRLGVWTDSWQAPRTGPIDYIASCGLVSDRLLAVHGVHLTDGELRTLASAGATVVTCPRSNRWVGAGLPPVERFYASGVRVAVGTDSLASVEDLNVFAELHLMRQLAPSIAPARILESATKSGADALGFGDELGTVEPGKRAELIAVAVPATVTDVEEYLLTGIRPLDIRWLAT